MPSPVKGTKLYSRPAVTAHVRPEGQQKVARRHVEGWRRSRVSVRLSRGQSLKDLGTFLLGRGRRREGVGMRGAGRSGRIAERTQGHSLSSRQGLTKWLTPALHRPSFYVALYSFSLYLGQALGWASGGSGQVPTPQGSPAGWRPREALMLQLVSGRCRLLAEFFLVRGR